MAGGRKDAMVRSRPSPDPLAWGRATNPVPRGRCTRRHRAPNGPCWRVRPLPTHVSRRHLKRLLLGTENLLRLWTASAQALIQAEAGG